MKTITFTVEITALVPDNVAENAEDLTLDIPHNKIIIGNIQTGENIPNAITGHTTENVEVND